MLQKGSSSPLVVTSYGFFQHCFLLSFLSFDLPDLFLALLEGDRLTERTGVAFLRRRGLGDLRRLGLRDNRLLDLSGD